MSQLAEQSAQQRDYRAAVELLEKAGKKAHSDEERTELYSKLDKARALMISKDSYEAGLRYFNDKEFSSAFDAFVQVIPESGHYSDAKAKKQICASWLSDDALRRAKLLHNEGKVLEAIAFLRAAKRYGDTSGGELLVRYKKEGASMLDRKAKNLAAKGDYGEAIEALGHAKELGSKEAHRLIPKYEAARQKQEKAERERQERFALQQERESARSFEGDGAVRIAVSRVRLHRSTELHTANANSTYVSLAVAALNEGDEIIHVNPNDFTLADSDGNTASHHTDTYSLSNYFDAVDLRPGQQTSGWLIFLMSKDERYTLGYQSFQGGTAEKTVIP